MSTEKKDPFDGDYVGSIFGPKLTTYALIIILVTGLLVFGRHYFMDVPLGFDDPLAPVVVDTIRTDSL